MAESAKADADVPVRTNGDAPDAEKAVPLDDEVLIALQTIRRKDPNLGLKKVHDQLKSDFNWQLSLGRLKKLQTEHALGVAGPSCFKVVPISGKGLGVVATKNIKQGALILSEHPLLISGRAFADQGFDLLPPEHQALFLTLTAAGPGPSLKERIFQSNAYRWEDGMAALFPTIPRLNHACTPNANYVPDFKTVKGAFFALRDIQAGEEITSVYTERAQPRIVRRRILKENCGCRSRWTRDDDMILNLRRQMAKHLDSIIDKDRSFRRSIMAVHLRHRLLLEDNLDGPDIARTLNDAVQLCAPEGKLVLLSCYARLAEQKYRAIGRFDAANGLIHLIKKPHEHPGVRTDAPKQIAGEEESQFKLKLGAEGLQMSEVLPAIWASYGFEGSEVEAFEQEIRDEAQKGLQALEAAAHRPKPSGRR